MKTTDHDHETDAARQLRQIATAIETYRADLGMTKATLLRTYPELGTDKSYGKIIAGDFTELKIEDRWLPAWSHVWSQIQAGEDDDDSELIANMSGPTELCRAYLETRNEKGNARFILALGDTGVGKSSAVRILRAKPYGGLITAVEACEIWKGKTGRGSAIPLLREIGRASGLRDLPAGRDRLLTAVVDGLSAKRRGIVIDELHHLCPEGVNTLKALINLTPSIIIGMAMPVLWDKLSGSRAGWIECKQIKGNRLAEVIHMRLLVEDVLTYLQARLADLQLSDAFLADAARRLQAEAVHLGNLAFVKAAVRRFRREVRAGEEPSKETLSQVIASEKKRR